jgi:predicted transcriptional regulator of viral defense system
VKGRPDPLPPLTQHTQQNVGGCIYVPTFCIMLRMKTNNSEQKILKIIKGRGVVRPADLQALGIPRSRLYRLVGKGLLERRARGIYVVSDHPTTAEHTLVQVAKRVPNGVVCLLTALRFHELTTQMPPEVWIALPEKARRPRLDYPRLRVARFSGPALTQGIETHVIEGVEVRVYSAAKTVTDCFKYRNKIGVDVAVEALKDFTRRHRGGATDLARFARICRVTRVMQPYLDSIS